MRRGGYRGDWPISPLVQTGSDYWSPSRVNMTPDHLICAIKGSKNEEDNLKGCPLANSGALEASK